MFEKYVSDRILNEAPRALTNFLWYLWETYCNPNDSESRFILQSDAAANRQNITILSTEETLSINFGTCINAKIVIRKNGSDYYMLYED